MDNNDKLFKYLKNLEVPKVENKTHKEMLREKILIEMQKMEIESKDIKENTFFLNIFNKYTLSLTFFLVVILIGIISYFYFFHSYKITVKPVSYEGIVYIIDDNNQHEKIDSNFNIKNNSTIKTDKDTELRLKLGYDSFINIYSMSEIKLLSLVKKNKSERSKIFLKEGKVEFNINLPTSKSFFEVLTGLSSFHVTGTQFLLITSEEKGISLRVKKGKVEVNKFIAESDILKKIHKKDKDLYVLLKKILDDKIIINDNSSLFMSKEDLNMINNDFIELLNNIYDKVSIEGKLSLNEKNKIISKVLKFQKKKDTVFNRKRLDDKDYNDAVKEDEDFYIFNVVKLENKPGELLSEINTSITTDNNNIIVASDFNNKIYYIDSENGKLIWDFKHNDLKNITSPAVPFKDNIVIGSPGVLIILDSKGNIKIKKDLIKGPSYWISPIVVNNELYIPTSETIYKFADDKLNSLDNFPKAMGPLYINGDSQFIYYVDLNEQRIKIYDLYEKKLSWISDEFYQRVFMCPIKAENYLYVADIAGKLYRYDIAAKNKIPPQILNLETGVLTNILYYGNKLFFVGNNGYFYSVISDKFISFTRLDKIDNNPNPDKYLIKKLLYHDGFIYFSSDNGSLFCYNVNTQKSKLINISSGIPLIASPVLINGKIYVIDKNFNIYNIKKSF